MDLLKRNFAANQRIVKFLQEENASLQKQLAEAKSEKSVGSRVVHEKDDTQPSQTPLQAVKNAHRAHCAQLQGLRNIKTPIQAVKKTHSKQLVVLRNEGKEQSQPEGKQPSQPKVNAAAPQLKGHKNEVRTRLGQAFQNKRKYRNDVKVGKRKGKNGNKDANTDEKVQCRKFISKFLEREAASSCSQNSTDCDSSTDTSTKKSPDTHSSAFSVEEEVFVYKTAEKRLKLAKAFFVGPDDESDKAGMYSLLQLNTKYIKEDEEIPLPAETADGDLTLNEVQVNGVFTWKTIKLSSISKKEPPRKKLKSQTPLVTMSKGEINAKEDCVLPKSVQNPSSLVKGYDGGILSVGQWVAVDYNKKFYIGKITAIELLILDSQEEMVDITYRMGKKIKEWEVLVADTDIVTPDLFSALNHVYVRRD